MYFFRRAASLTREELLQRLPDPIFAEAVGVLEMIAKNPEERQVYDDRLKAERDERARTEQARLEGIEQGIEQGQRIERIRVVRMLRDLVGDLTPPDKELMGFSLDDLTKTEVDLQRRLRERT